MVRAAAEAAYVFAAKKGACRETRPLCFEPLVANLGYFKASMPAPKLM